MIILNITDILIELSSPAPVGQPRPFERSFLRKLCAQTQNYGPLAPGPALVSTPALEIFLQF